MARSKGAPPPLTLVPAAEIAADPLRQKLDKLAFDLADSLMDRDTPVAERIAGLKALAAYHDSKGGGKAPAKNAFDTYRSAIGAQEE